MKVFRVVSYRRGLPLVALSNNPIEGHPLTHMYPHPVPFQDSGQLGNFLSSGMPGLLVGRARQVPELLLVTSPRDISFLRVASFGLGLAMIHPDVPMVVRQAPKRTSISS